MYAESQASSLVIGGVQAGFNYRLASGILFGVEVDLSFPNYLPTNHVVSGFATARSNAEERWDYFGTARGRGRLKVLSAPSGAIRSS